MDEATGSVGHADDSEEVEVALHVAKLTGNRPVPGHGVVAGSKILVVEELETDVLHGGETLADGHHVGDTVADLDGETNVTVLDVVVVIVVGHEPLIDTENTTGLEDTVDLTVDTLELGSVDGSLDGVDGIERVVRERHLHEVALDELELTRETVANSVVGGAVDLVVVVVEAGDVSISELGDFARRATDTATNIENLHALLDADLGSEIVLVTGNSLVERLAGGEAAEVEGLAPTILVDIGREVVVAARDRFVSLDAFQQSKHLARQGEGKLTAWSRSRTPWYGPRDQRRSRPRQSCCRSA